MVEELIKLKDKIMRGTTQEADVDTVNQTIHYIRDLESKTERIIEIPSQEDFSMGYGVNVTIHHATIHIGGGESRDPPHPER